MRTALVSRRLMMSGIAMSIALTGCPATPPARFFTLAPRPAEPTGRAIAMKISVKPVQVAKYLDRPQIGRYGDAYQLKLSEFDRWGEGLGDMTTRVLVVNLAERLPRSQVFAASGPLTMPGDISLEVEISRFEPDPENTVLLSAQWAIIRSETRRDQARSEQIRSEQIRVKMATDSAADQAAAMSDALGLLTDRIAAVLTS